MKKPCRVIVWIALSVMAAAPYSTFAAEERGPSPKPPRPPVVSPRNNRPLPSPNTKPAPSPSPTQSNNTVTSNPKWQYTIIQEGMSFIADGKENGALLAKMALMGVNGWELVTVYAEGGVKIFIYKRQL
jgi:hypothetical protein